MLIRFVIANFLSFDKEKEFNMLAGSYPQHKHHVYKAGKLNVLKGSAIYGANGAGKSNFVKAIDFLKKLVEEGALKESVASKKFKLNPDNYHLPTEFEIEFYYKRKMYAYGVSLNHHTVEKEWLYLSKIDKEDELVFERHTTKSGKSKIKLAPKYLKTAKQKLLVELMEDNLLKDNELLLSKRENFSIKDMDNVVEWVKEKLLIIFPTTNLLAYLNFSTIPDSSKMINEIIQSFDTGITQIKAEDVEFDKLFENNERLKPHVIEALDEQGFFLFSSVPNSSADTILVKFDNEYKATKLFTFHNDILFEVAEESDGTQRLLDMIYVVRFIIYSDLTIIIDEIDRSLHVNLLYQLVKKIMDEQGTKGQLIFTTHEASLLDLDVFRQDEIWFTEKDDKGSTDMYSLNTFKPVVDLDLRKGYLKGRFGAIPFLGNLKKLNLLKSNA